MKVKDLIKLLQEQDPELEVMIEQGEEYDYCIAYSVHVKEVYDSYNHSNDETIKAVVIDYV